MTYNLCRPYTVRNPHHQAYGPNCEKKKNVNLKHILELSLHVLMRASWTLRRVFTASHIGKLSMGGLVLKQKGNSPQRENAFHYFTLMSSIYIQLYAWYRSFFLVVPSARNAFFFSLRSSSWLLPFTSGHNSNVTISRKPFLVTWAKASSSFLQPITFFVTLIMIFLFHLFLG